MMLCIAVFVLLLPPPPITFSFKALITYFALNRESKEHRTMLSETIQVELTLEKELGTLGFSKDVLPVAEHLKALFQCQVHEPLV